MGGRSLSRHPKELGPLSDVQLPQRLIGIRDARSSRPEHTPDHDDRALVGQWLIKEGLSRASQSGPTFAGGHRRRLSRHSDPNAEDDCLALPHELKRPLLLRSAELSALDLEYRLQPKTP